MITIETGPDSSSMADQLEHDVLASEAHLRIDMLDLVALKRAMATLGWLVPVRDLDGAVCRLELDHLEDEGPVAFR